MGEDVMLPIQSLEGGKATVSRSSDWGCDDVINSAILSCETAVDLPLDWQTQKYPGCLPFFESQVAICVAHYEAQRGKCSAVAGGGQQSGTSESPSVFDGRWKVTDKNVYGSTNTWICELRTQGNQITKQCDNGSQQRGTLRGRVASMKGGSNSFAVDLIAVDDDTLTFTYPYGKGTYKRLR